MFSGFGALQLFWFIMEEIMGICDSADKKVVDIIKLEPCYEMCNNRLSMKPESKDYTRNTGEHLMLQDDFDNQTNIKTDNLQLGDQPHNTIDQVKIQPGMDRDSDIDLAYRIIDTYNICEAHPFKIDNENILPDTEMSLSIGQPNNIQAQLKVEVDYKTDFLCETTNTLNVLVLDDDQFVYSIVYHCIYVQFPRVQFLVSRLNLISY